MRRAAVAAAIAVTALAGTARAGDPLRVYKELETEHFLICYWEPLDDVARRVGVVAEHVHKSLSTALDHLPDVKTIIFIADDTDDANGFAGVLPRNAIQLYATGPTSFSELDDQEDWLYGLVAHEYTHILHLDTIAGAPAIYNRIFGKTWAPSQIMPRWLIEGIAVYEESRRTAGGRDRGTRFDQYIRIARHAGVDLRLDEVSGDPRQFPRGDAIYVYGSHFVKYVFDRFGDDALRAMAHIAGEYPVPFAVNRQIAKVVGKPFTELYDDWRAYLRDRYGMEETAAERRGLRVGRKLTHTAETNTFLRWAPDSKHLYWVQSDGYSLSWVRAMPTGGTQADARDVVQIEAMGPFDVEPDGSIVFEQGLTYRREYSFEDLVRWDAPTNTYTRLTHGVRARDPALSPDGRRVAFSKNEHSDSVLAVMDTVPDAEPSVVWRGDRYDEGYQPCWSPDGTRIVFSPWRSGNRDVVIVELASGATIDVTHDRAVDQQPAWSADGRYIFWSSDRTGIANIYAYDTRTRATWQVTNVWGGAFDPRPSPDGKLLVYEGAVAKGGYDIYELPLDPSTWLPARAYIDDKPPPRDIHDDETTPTAPRPYRALETLAPQTWTAQIVSTNTVDVQTAGTDAAGLHSWSLAVGTDLDTGVTDVGVGYGYVGWRPGFSFSGARSLVERGARIDGVFEEFPEEDWSGTVSLGVPFESRPDSSWSLSLDYDFDWYRQVGQPSGYGGVVDPNQRVPEFPVTNYVESGADVRLSFSNVRTVTFGLGSFTGFDASTAVRVDTPDLGSTYRDVTLSYAGDWYQNLHDSTTTFAFHIAGAFRAGDLVSPGGFALGGIGPQDVVQAIVNSSRAGTTGYLRGYPEASVTGNQYDLANLELRSQVLLIEHGLGTLPIYLRRVHLAALCDAGTAYNTSLDDSDLRLSVGGAVRLDAFFGYFVPGTFELGYSRGLINGGVGESWFLLTGSL